MNNWLGAPVRYHLPMEVVRFLRWQPAQVSRSHFEVCAQHVPLLPSCLPRLDATLRHGKFFSNSPHLSALLTDSLPLAQCLLNLSFVVLWQIPMLKVRCRLWQVSTHWSDISHDRWNSNVHAGAFKRIMTVGYISFRHIAYCWQFFSTHIW